MPSLGTGPATAQEDGYEWRELQETSELAAQFVASAGARQKKSAASRGRCFAARSLANTGEVIRHSSLTRS